MKHIVEMHSMRHRIYVCHKRCALKSLAILDDVFAGQREREKDPRQSAGQLSLYGQSASSVMVQ